VVDGKTRRLSRIFPRGSRRTVIVPVDDALIFGPCDGLERPEKKVADIADAAPDATLAFIGLFQRSSEAVHKIPGILNLTASTQRATHTSKVQVGTVEQAVQLGMDGVAVHVNVTSRYEGEMLRILGRAGSECARFGMPLLGIIYPRREGPNGDDNFDELRQADPDGYATLVAHCARIGVDLGADIIKTKYTGRGDTFQKVISASGNVPVVVAGGPMVEPRAALQIAFDVVSAGGAGVSFGRNVFGRSDPKPMIAALKRIVHDQATPDDAAGSWST
jgi:DhnA family fructose-bisphosphate aldolase class Ia